MMISKGVWKELLTLCSLILTVNQGHVRTDPMSLTTNEFKTKISRQRIVAKIGFLEHLHTLGIGTDGVPESPSQE